MDKSINILSLLNPQYFWDVDFDSLNPEKSTKLMVERVITLGTSVEIHALISYLGKEDFIRIITSLNYLDTKTLNFVSLYLGIPLEQFKCYTRKQLNRQHWNS